MKTEREAPALGVLSAVRIFRSASDALFAQANLHQQLAKVEWEEEKRRLAQLFLTYTVGLSCLMCLMLFLGLLLMALSWDTQYRAISIAALCSLYSLGVYIAWSLFRKLAASPEAFFANTRKEIAADLSMIRSKF